MKKCFLTMLLFFAAFSMMAQNVKKVAILETVDKENKVDYVHELMLRANLTKAITNTPGYEAYDRTDIDQIMSEHDFQRTGMVSEDQIKRIGVMTGASYVLIAEAAKADANNLFITAKIVDVETAKTERTDNKLISINADAIQRGCNELAFSLLGGVRQQASGNSQQTTVNRQQASGNASQDISGTINGHEYVDLGLSVKWATCNVGASKPEDYGNYYAWGETSTKSSYTESNSKTYGKRMNDIRGNSQYDAARANWGGTWRLPTKAELEELTNKCTWKWTTQNGVKGYKVTGPNGNSIFLPAAGYRYGSSLCRAGEYGDYWSSSPDGGDGNGAYGLRFGSGTQRVGWNGRSLGRSVRPVSE